MITGTIFFADAAVSVFKCRRWALVRGAALVLGMAFLTAIAAGVKFQIGIVPVTLQTFIVLLSGVLLGSKRGAAAQLAYVSAGLAGVPWFSNGGGLPYLFSPTFGYLLGFVPAAFAVGFFAERGWSKKIITLVAALLVGNACIYFFGLLWLSKFVPQEHLLNIGLYPFIFGDALKISAISILLFVNLALMGRGNK